jgi:hypothetical protein
MRQAPKIAGCGGNYPNKSTLGHRYANQREPDNNKDAGTAKSHDTSTKDFAPNHHRSITSISVTSGILVAF